MSMDAELYTSEEVARLLGVKPRRVRALAAEGRLRCFKLGRDNVYRAEDVAAFAAIERPSGRPKGTPTARPASLEAS